MSRDTVWRSMYSDMSNRMSSTPIVSASCRVTSVLPTPVGPENRNDPTGRRSSPNPERAIAFYAGRLGLDLRLDRSNPQWGARLLFFRCDDLVVEIAHDLRKGVSDAPDTLWGLSWRATDIAAARQLLKPGANTLSIYYLNRTFDLPVTVR